MLIVVVRSGEAGLTTKLPCDAPSSSPTSSTFCPPGPARTFRRRAGRRTGVRDTIRLTPPGLRQRRASRGRAAAPRGVNGSRPPKARRPSPPAPRPDPERAARTPLRVGRRDRVHLPPAHAAAPATAACARATISAVSSVRGGRCRRRIESTSEARHWLRPGRAPRGVKRHVLRLHRSPARPRRHVAVPHR